MTELVLKAGRSLFEWTGLKWPANGWRLLILAFLGSLALASPELREIVCRSISDAYLQVTVFVAATLALVYILEDKLKFDVGQLMRDARHFQAPIASFLGALPGCGGAIIVVTQYIRGYTSFGSIVAVLIATMGDAAFLLIAREPSTGLTIIAVGFCVGTLSGWLVDALHGQDFMRVTKPPSKSAQVNCSSASQRPLLGTRISDKTSLFNWPWIALAIPGSVLGLCAAMLVNTDSFFGPLEAFHPTLWFGVTGGVFCLLMWGLSKQEKAHIGSADMKSQDAALAYGNFSTVERIVKDTNFVTSWVVMGFLAYELAVFLAGSSIEVWLQVWAPFVPLMAIVIGFIPGCGPQIVIATLYLSGAISFSAELGNAISNDGDALFPALALAPRAALLATLYSAVPAIILAYGVFFLFES